MDIFQKMLELEMKWVVVGTALGFLVMLAGGLNTERHFALVSYPGADFGGVPLTFDLSVKNANIETLKELETLDLFVFVQYLDFGIVLGTLPFFTFLGLLMLKFVGKNTPTYAVGVVAVAFYLLAPVMDAFENLSLLSYLDVREYTDVEWLNTMNSIFNIGKIGFFYLGWVASFLVLISIIVRATFWKRPNI